MKQLKPLIFGLLLVITCAFNAHKFYIGVFQIDYFKEKKSIQITTRLFIDDFEKVLHKKYNKHFYITTKDEVADANLYVSKYLQEKLKIKVNNKNHPIEFLLKEQEENVLICYLRIKFSEKIKTIEITNNVLTEEFNEQQNLVHLNINGNKKTLLFTNDNNIQKSNY